MANTEQLSVPMYFPKENPRGWHRAVSKKVKTRQTEYDHESLYAASERVQCEQEQRWHEITGERPEDSHFTVIMPIHNEKKAFTSAFASLMMSDIPPSVHMQVILIPNACSDGTEEIVKAELTRIGTVENRLFDEKPKDEGIYNLYREVRSDNRRFLQVTTNTPGKANALTIGNELAIREGNKIAICIDANNYLEPDAIPLVYGRATQSIGKDASTVIVSGKGYKEDITSFLTPFIGKMKSTDDDRDSFKTPPVNGALHAWDTEWVKEIGGMPRVTFEDMALGLLAWDQGKTVGFVEDAKTWFYENRTYAGEWNHRERTAIGYNQMMRLYPQMRPILENAFLVWPFERRAKVALEYVKEHPHKLPLKAATFILWEAFHAKVRRRLEKDFYNHSWPDVPGTK